MNDTAAVFCFVTIRGRGVSAQEVGIGECSFYEMAVSLLHFMERGSIKPTDEVYWRGIVEHDEPFGEIFPDTPSLPVFKFVETFSTCRGARARAS